MVKGKDQRSRSFESEAEVFKITYAIASKQSIKDQSGVGKRCIYRPRAVSGGLHVVDWNDPLTRNWFLGLDAASIRRGCSPGIREVDIVVGSIGCAMCELFPKVGRRWVWQIMPHCFLISTGNVVSRLPSTYGTRSWRSPISTARWRLGAASRRG